jgi:2',3'-cyclic-nucleotide 2'-phosphodiesterase (5'-nucleotidase family)
MDDDLSAQVDRTTLEALALEPTIPQFKHSQEYENLRKQFPPTNIFKKTGDMNTYPAHLLINLAVLILVNPFVCSACDGHHLHTRSQPHSTQPLDAPTRQLEWGDLNIIHTTDTHVHVVDSFSPLSPQVN